MSRCLDIVSLKAELDQDFRGAKEHLEHQWTAVKELEPLDFTLECKEAYFPSSKWREL